MTTVEEHTKRLEICRLHAAFDPGDGQLVGVGVRLAEDVDVPAEVEGGGEDHHARVVHPLAVLSLPAGQVGQTPALAVEDDTDGGLLDVLRKVAEIVTDLLRLDETNTKNTTLDLTSSLRDLKFLALSGMLWNSTCSAMARNQQFPSPLVGGLGVRARLLAVIRSSIYWI